METFLKRIGRNITAMADLFVGIARRIDYKTLSRYVLGIHQRNDLNGILDELSACLKDLLNYRLFAFALKTGDQVNVWIDPQLYEQEIQAIITKDFGQQGTVQIHQFSDSQPYGRGPLSFNRESLLSYVLLDEQFQAKLYVLPERRMLGYHGDLLNIIIKTLGNAIARLMNLKNLENAAAIDPLTGCYNRREFNRHLELSAANAERYGNPLSIIMFDLDHFKNINDTHGHAAGDQVLKEISGAVASVIRKGDYLARYGGEEFVVVLPSARLSKAMELAERLRSMVERMTIPVDEHRALKVTASFGVATFRKGVDKDTMLMEADAMLYKAKEMGRNRVMPQLKLYQQDTGC